MPSASVDPAPLNCTVEGTLTAWVGPAFATGAALRVEIVTVAGALFRKPSLAISCTT